MKDEFRTIYIKAIDSVVDSIDLRFNQPNFKAYEQLELLLLEALAELESNDFADETEYLKPLTMMVIVPSCYYEKGIFQQSNELHAKKFFRGLHPRTHKLHSLHFLIAPWSLETTFGSFHDNFVVLYLLKSFIDLSPQTKKYHALAILASTALLRSICGCFWKDDKMR